MRDNNETNTEGEINRGCKVRKKGRERERRKGERMRKR